MKPLQFSIALLMIIHGLIHLLGFVIAFDYIDLQSLPLELTRFQGIGWLISSLFFLASALLFFIQHLNWWMLTAVSIILSQYLIIMNWNEARAGTLVNLILFCIVIAAWGAARFENAYRKDVRDALSGSQKITGKLITESDISALPQPVQLYIRRSNSLGKPPVKNMRVTMEGRMRGRNKKWFPILIEQYNFFGNYARYFFIKAHMFGLIVPGYHRYKEASAGMDIRLFGLIPVIKQHGGALNKAETVTLLNEICLMAPAALIDKRIRWETIDAFHAKAIFTNGHLEVSAILEFNRDGEMINFYSNDRTDTSDMKQYPFSTPCSGYKDFQGYWLMSEGKAIWHYPESPFVYGEFMVKKIEYNIN